MKLLKTAVLTSVLLAGSAFADPIYIDIDSNGTKAGPITQLDVAYDSFTTINLFSNAVTTIAGVSAIGTAYTDFEDMTTEGLGFTNIIGSTPNHTNSEYNSSGSFLTFGVNLTGEFNELTGITYTSGTFSLYSGDYTVDFFTAQTENQQLLFSADFVSGGFAIGNQDIIAHVDAGTFTALGEDTFFADVSGTLTPFEEYLSQDPSNIISLLIQQNVAGGALQLLADVTAEIEAGNVDQEGNVQVSAGHSASLIANVPEPTTLAILGLGLLGLAGTRRTRS